MAKGLTRYVAGAMGLLAVVGTIVAVVHLSLPELPPRAVGVREVPREHSQSSAVTFDDVLAARDMALAEDATLEQVLQETIRWAERVSRLEPELLSSASLRSPEDAKRRIHEGCQSLTTALLNAVRRSESWGAPVAALSESSSALARQIPGRQLELLRDTQRNIVKLQAELAVQPEVSTKFSAFLGAEDFIRLSHLVASSALLQSACAFDPTELERRYSSEVRWGIVEGDNGLALAEEWDQVAEVVGAFLELELLTLPAPERCELTPEHDFEWVPEALDAAGKALKHLPLATVKRLLELDEDRLGPLLRHVSRALPIAACEKVTQLLCSHLKRARREQRETTSIAALRARAQSLASAHSSLVQLAREGRAYGCESLGGADGEAYASRLISQGHALALGSVPRLAERVRGFSATPGREGGVREQVLAELRLQRMETAAVGLGVIEPGLGYLVEAGKSLTPTAEAWRNALRTIDGRASASGEQSFTDGGLKEFEQLLGLLLMRNNELCELASSSSVSAILGNRVGVFYELGKALISELTQSCRES